MSLFLYLVWGSILITIYKIASWKRSYDQPRQHIKKWRHYFANKGPSSQSYGFSSGHVCMWELDYKEGWAPKNWCFLMVVLKKILEGPLNCKEIQPVHPTGNQSWIFIGRTDAEAETPILWPLDSKNWLIRKESQRFGHNWVTKLIYEIDKQQGFVVQHRVLYSIFCNNL